MSGHSKWANIRVKKGAEDRKRSAIFTKVARNIRAAVKMGGGADIENNWKLRAVAEKAREVNMPKENIDRILKKFKERKDNLVSVCIEGYGPSTIPVIVEIETDNKIRTSNEVRMILENYGGCLASNNAVMHLFDKMGRVELTKIDGPDWEKLIDLGAEDIEESTVYVHFEDLGRYVKDVGESGFEVIDSGVYFKPRVVSAVDVKDREKCLEMVEELLENDDVTGVFTGLDKTDE